MGKSIGSQIIASVFVNSLYMMANYPLVLVSTVLAPFSLLIAITFVSHGTLLPIAIGGAFILSMIGAGTGMQQDLSHFKNDFKLQDMVVSSPTSAAIYFLGMSVSELVYTIPVIIVLGILAFFYVHASLLGFAELAAVLIILFAFSCALGFVLSTFSSDVVESWAYAGIVSTVLSALPPVYYPITYIPMPFQYLAYLSPATYGAEIMQSITGVVSFSGGMLAVDWVVIIGVTLAMLAIAVKRSRWREK
jgi:ABC-2 type transport system permease protein